MGSVMTAPAQIRFRMTLAYDGTRFAGMQFLPGVVTVQGEVESALGEILNGPVKIEPASRTDAGVHAAGQVAHFEAAAAMAPARLRHALNRLLPDDIRVTALRTARPDFHARFDATGKEYRYLVHNGRVLPPFLRLYRHHEGSPLDLAAMRRAARALVGTHDFAAFTVNPGYDQGDTVRRIDRIAVHKRGDEVEIRVAGGGFLYRMVRSMAGWLIMVGKGRAAPEPGGLLEAGAARPSEVVTAPAKGLFLWRVLYRS